MFLEYDRNSNRYRSRGLGAAFTSIVGLLSFATLADARRELFLVGLRLSNTIDPHTWKIEALFQPTDTP
jgi:hypothetical protein